MTETPRGVRIPDELWTAAVIKAREENTTISHLIRVWLERYLQSP